MGAPGPLGGRPGAIPEAIRVVSSRPNQFTPTKVHTIRHQISISQQKWVHELKNHVECQKVASRVGEKLKKSKSVTLCNSKKTEGLPQAASC